MASFYPEMLYELPCEWNYRVWLCSEVNTPLNHQPFWTWLSCLSILTQSSAILDRIVLSLNSHSIISHSGHDCLVCQFSLNPQPFWTWLSCLSILTQSSAILDMIVLSVNSQNLPNSFIQGENKCPSAEENGVSLLHGNALAFVKVSREIY